MSEELCPSDPRAPELLLECRLCKHTASAEYVQECLEAEALQEDCPRLMTVPEGALSRYHYLNFQIAWTYFFECADLQDAGLRSHHRSVCRLLIASITRLQDGQTPALLPLYQMMCELWSGDEEAQLEYIEDL